MLILRDWKSPEKDFKKRLSYPKYEINKIILRSLLAHHNYSVFWKLYFQKVFQTYPISSSLSSYKNYCMGFSVRGKVVFRLFKFSRHQAKHYASNGFLYGFRKSSF